MIVWLNGAPSTGKTSAARELTDLIPGSTLYDPEVTGKALRRLLPPKRWEGIADYPDLPVWRQLVADTAAALLAELGGTLVIPMTLLRREHRDEIFGRLAARRIPVRHVLLFPDETILRDRMPGREELEHDCGGGARSRREGEDPLTSYRAALPWLTADAYAIDTSGLTSRQTAVRIAEAVRTDAAKACAIVQTPEPRAETVAAGVLLFDEQDRVLLVDPTYKPGWEFPGGVVESGESPARAGMREVTEEIGIELDRVPSLLVVDWEPPRPPAFGGLRLLFDGGRLGSDSARRLLLPDTELRDWRFVTEEEAAELLPAVRFNRLRWALRARERSTVLNLEAGVPVGRER